MIRNPDLRRQRKAAFDQGVESFVASKSEAIDEKNITMSHIIISDAGFIYRRRDFYLDEL